jgi:hypothetical protein
MTALHTRLRNTNDLFALEQGHVERSNGLFEASARPPVFDRTLERYRAVRALLDDEDALLAMGRDDWMGQGTLQLGPVDQATIRKGGTHAFACKATRRLRGSSQPGCAVGSRGDRPNDLHGRTRPLQLDADVALDGGCRQCQRHERWWRRHSAAATKCSCVRLIRSGHKAPIRGGDGQHAFPNRLPCRCSMGCFNDPAPRLRAPPFKRTIERWSWCESRRGSVAPAR